MLRHYMLLIYRNFKRHKSSFVINLTGLSIGLTAVLMIYLWVNNELNVDKFHENDDRLFQVMIRVQNAGGAEVTPITPPVLPAVLKEEMPEIEYAVAEVLIPIKSTLAYDDHALKTTGVYAGEDYFNMFSYELPEGDKNNALANENSIVLSRELAIRLFGTAENVLGKPVKFENEDQFFVSGIFNIPPGSSKQFDFVLPFKVQFRQYPNLKDDWSNSWSDTYVLLKEGTDAEAFKGKVKDVLKKRAGAENATLIIRPYSERYLYSNYENGVQVGGRIAYVKLFSVMAVFILLIACINFINLSTARAGRRMKEIGVKKTLGAERKTLVLQYLGESLLMTFLSLVIAVGLIFLLLPHFNEITGKQLPADFRPELVLSFLAIAALTGLIAGSYPALYLSSFNAVNVLKGKLFTSWGEVWTRNGLVVFQFTISVVFIVAVLVVYRQLYYIQNKNMGYNKENILYFQIEENLKDHREAFLSEVKKINGVKGASSMFMTFFGDLNSTSDLAWQGKDPDENINMQYRRVNYDMIELLGIEMKDGRAFSREFGSEDHKIIFNREAIRKMGLNDPVGKTIKLWGNDLEILGVTENFHYESLHESIEPLFFILNPERTNMIMLKIDPENLMSTVETVNDFYNEFTKGAPFDFHFLNEVFQAQYETEKRVEALSAYFAGLAVFISCLGLLGLAAFTVERRRKEIGIRKVLGSGARGVFTMLSGDFTRMVVIAIAVALPVSYLIAGRWLESFAYSVELEWWYFASAGLASLVVAWLTISVQTVKAAMSNPAESLKEE